MIPSDSPPQSRREFLRVLETLAVPLIYPGIGALAAGCVPAPVSAPAPSGGRLAVAKRDLGKTSYALVEAEGLSYPVYLHRHEDGRYTAVLTRCMHQGCQVAPESGRLVCPCHGSEYTAAGVVLKGPTPAPLTSYPVTEDAERVYVHLDGRVPPV